MQDLSPEDLTADDASPATANLQARMAFQGIISSVFMKFLR